MGMFSNKNKRAPKKREGLMILRSVADGRHVQMVDDGQSASGAFNPGRTLIHATLAKKSGMDGKAFFRVISYTPARGFEPINVERLEWAAEDDARLEVHLSQRNKVCRAAKSSSSIQARREAEQKAKDQDRADLQKQISEGVVAAMKAAREEEARLAEEEKAAKAAKSKPKKKADDE